MTHPDTFGARSTLAVGGTDLRDLPARRAAGALRRRAAPVHAADPARERPPARGRRRPSRRRTSRRSPSWVATRRAVARDLVHAGPRAPPGLHRRPGRRRPRGDARRDARRSAATRARSTRCIPVELVIDHSVQVDEFASAPRDPRATPSSSSSATASATRSCAGARSAFDDFKVVPPEHRDRPPGQPRVPRARRRASGTAVAFPDTLVGTDSHTTMINGLGVLGWGVGGIEAEAAMLGEAISMLVPQVVGFRLDGRAARRARPRPTSCSR